MSTDSISASFKLFVGNQGRFDESGKYHTTRAQIDLLFQTLAAERCADICLYFHGGLVPEDEGLKNAQRLEKILDQKTFKVFFVWKTGAFETIRQNVLNVSDYLLFNKVRDLVLQTFGPRMVRGGAGAGGNINGSEFAKKSPFSGYSIDDSKRPGSISKGKSHTFIRNEAVLEREIEQIIGSDDDFKRAIHEYDNRNGQHVSKGISLALAKSIVKIMLNIDKRLRTKRDHGIYPTIVEEIMRELYIAEAGAWVWRKMKDKAEKMWGYTTHDPDFIGNYFLKKLEAYCTAVSCRLHLVGHSAGSIAICHLIKNIVEQKRSIRIKQVIFLAPACTHELFYNAIVKTKRAESFSLFILKDSEERKDMAIPYVYPLSLLYLVSGIFENDGGMEWDVPLVGMERFLNNGIKLKNLERIRSFLANGRLVLAGDAGEFISKSQTHGGFDDDDATVLSINKLFVNGTKK